MEKHKDLIEKIEKLSVLELHELVKALEEKFGVSAAAVAPASAQGSGEAKEIAIYKLMPEAIEAMQRIVEEKIKVFGSAGKIEK